MSRRGSNWLVPGEEPESDEDVASPTSANGTVAAASAATIPKIEDLEVTELEEERTVERFLMWQTISAVFDAYASTLAAMHEREGLYLYSNAAASLTASTEQQQHPGGTTPQRRTRPPSVRASPAKSLATPGKSPAKPQRLMELEGAGTPTKNGAARQDVEYALKGSNNTASPRAVPQRSTSSRPVVALPSPTKKPANGVMPVSRQSSAAHSVGPVLSVKALQTEKQRCEERKAALRSKLQDGPQQQPDAQRRQNTVLHRGPLQQSRDISTQRSRSPMASRASPVGVSAPNSARPVSPYGRTSSATRSVVSRTDSAPRTLSSARAPSAASRPPSSSRPPSTARSVSNERSRSVGALADPRKLPTTKLSSSGGTSSQPNSARSTSASQPPSARSMSAQSQQRAPGSAVPPIRRSSLLPTGRRGTIVITNTGKATPRAGSNANVTAADFFDAVLHCRINRSLEVAETTSDGCLLQQGDLLLEVNGKGISTIEHLRTTIEELYGVTAGSAVAVSDGDPAETKSFRLTLLRDVQCMTMEVEGPMREAMAHLVG